MANGYYGDKAVILPNMFQPPGFALENRIRDINNLNERQLELDYRDRVGKASDEWRKVNLIQELTDISKYQTGSDVADEIGRRKMGEIYQRYTSLSPTMSPAELQANIQKDMSSVIGGLNSAKQELNMADEQLKILKQKYPSLDIAKLQSEYRNEILQRRIDKDEFRNPLTVGMSSFDILNPDFLSKYIVGNANLTKAIQNPQGSETRKVFKGSPSAYTEYTAKLNPWKRESFDRESLRSGFLSGSGEPRLEIRARQIPGINTVDGKPFIAVDEDVYDRFKQDETMNLELTAATRQKYRDYDNFSQEEKNLAKRNVLYDKIKELDVSDYYPTEVRRPPRTTINVGGGSRETIKADANNWLKNTIDAISGNDFQRMTEQFSILERGGRFVDFKVSVDGDEVVVEYKKPDESEKIVMGGTSMEVPGTMKTITRRFKKDAMIGDKLKGIYQAATGDDKVFEYSSVPKNEPPKPKSKTYKYKGYEYTEQEITDAAKQLGMTKEQYMKKYNIQ